MPTHAEAKGYCSEFGQAYAETRNCRESDSRSGEAES